MMMLAQALEDNRNWTGSMSDLAAIATALCATHPIIPGVFVPATTRSLVISYRSLRILSPAAGKKFRWEHLVQLISARYLGALGTKREEIARRLKGVSADSLLQHFGSLENLPTGSIAQSDPPPSSNGQVEEAILATRLLAAGLVAQFRSARAGSAVVHDATLEPLLSQAMLMFAGQSLREARDPGCLGSTHDLLVQCGQPIASDTWGLDVLGDPGYPYRGLTLLDPHQRIPTLDCVELASQTQSELDLRESMAFEGLRAICEQFVGKPDVAYTDLRFWVAQHPTTTVQEMRGFERSHDLQLAENFLSGCYEQVQPYHLASGKLYLCKRCKVPMRRARALSPLLACAMPQCSQFERPVEALPQIWNADVVVAKAHILAYWIGPAIDEIALYRAAVAQELAPKMYPGRDACDLAIDNDQVGIDVKSNASPFVLAASLNKSVHGLALYARRIVAVNDQAISRVSGYLEILRREYVGAVALEFMSVRDVIRALERPF